MTVRRSLPFVVPTVLFLGAAMSANAQTPLASLPKPTPLVKSELSAEENAAAIQRLAKRLDALEQENAHLRAQVTNLQTDLKALSAAYQGHTHELSGILGNGLTVVDGRTLVTGSYSDASNRRTGSVQPIFVLPSETPPSPVKPTKPTPKPSSKGKRH